MLFDESYFQWPIISEKAVQKMNHLLAEGNISFDSRLSQELETRFQDYFCVPHALLTCNGTSAAFSAFHAIQMQPEDEIIAPPYTHPATVLPATLLGGKIIFTDFENTRFTPALDALERAVTRRTKAVVVCHLYGNPVDIVAIRELCDAHHLLLLEDISHAIGATVGGRRVGSFGDIAFFSMQASKLIAAGEGGALLTPHFDYYARALELGHPKRIKELPPERQRYQSGLGYKFRLSTLHAALALESFCELDTTIRIRNEMCDALRSKLKAIPGIYIPEVMAGAKRVYWQQELFIQDSYLSPSEVRNALQQAEVNAFGANFEILPDLPHFKNQYPYAFPNARELVQRMILLPPFTRQNPALIEKYRLAFQKVLAAPHP